MEAESNRYDLVENFSGLKYIGDAQLENTGKLLKTTIELIPVGRIAVFLLCLAVAVSVSAFFFDVENVFVYFFASLCCAGVFTGMLWLFNQSSTSAKLPSIDQDRDELILPSGTRIGKEEISHFHQFECKTKISNFRLVLTTVITSDQNKQFAVCAEIGRFKTTKIGREIACYFSAEVLQDAKIVTEQKLLEKFSVA